MCSRHRPLWSPGPRSRRIPRPPTARSKSPRPTPSILHAGFTAPPGFPDFAQPVAATMKVLGLAGGIGMGKSVVADILRRKGLPVVDSDLLARQLVEKGQPALEEIAQAFGTEM